jgi:copper chaperone CopZ
MIEGLVLGIVEYYLGDQVSSQQIKTISRALSAIDGVESAEIHSSSISVQYYPDILSKESIRRELVRLGVSLEQNGKQANPFTRFINRLAQSNSKAFGSEPLDCCKLNSKQRLKP